MALLPLWARDARATQGRGASGRGAGLLPASHWPRIGRAAKDDFREDHADTWRNVRHWIR
jgi:hypothetical protein